MTKPKPLEQLRADKEQAETQLAQEQHKLERLENRKKYLEQGVQAATSAEAKRSRGPAGPRRLGTATRISASLFRRLSAFFESISRPRPKSGKVCRSDTRPGDVGERAERSESSDTTPIRNAPCFAV